MELIKKIKVEFNGLSKPSLSFTKDVSNYPVIKFMAMLTGKYAVTQDPLFSKWDFYINGKRIENQFTAQSISLKRLGISSEPVLIQISYKEERIVYEQQEGKKFDLNAKLRKTMKENEVLFMTELMSNGMVSREIQFVMGHFQSKLKEIELTLSMEYIYFNMDFQSQNSPVHLIDNVPANKELCFSPYCTPGHVALLCIMGNKYFHIDPSGSVSFNNVEIFQKKFKNISYTYINYQMLEDDTLQDYASGNCAIFMCLNLLRFIVHYNEYKEKMGFDAFWERLARVIEMSDLMACFKIVRMLFINIKYMTLTDNGQSKSDYGRSVKNIKDEFELPESYEEMRLAIKDMSIGIDFTSDCVMLDLFIASGMGFQDITKFGNKLRELVRQITAYGFVDSYIKIFN